MAYRLRLDKSIEREHYDSLCDNRRYDSLFQRRRFPLMETPTGFLSDMSTYKPTSSRCVKVKYPKTDISILVDCFEAVIVLRYR